MARISGTARNDRLTGTTEDDLIDGLAGADAMMGGKGNDVYVVDDAGDVVIERAGEGIDQVESSVDYVLPANVENLVLTRAAKTGTGNDLDNAITGNASDNILDGGRGVDLMTGGDGNDTYYVDSVRDKIVETAGAGSGIDEIHSSVDYTLPANVEKLDLMGIAVMGVGNDLDNTIQGNASRNILIGGAGVDTMVGGADDDIYYVDNPGDIITELPGQGQDLVYSTAASYVLPAEVERLQLTGGAVSGTGNASDNVIYGSDGSNTLDGGAGGHDYLFGGKGDDTYMLDSFGTDEVIESAGQGIDTIMTTFDVVLPDNVENLSLLGTCWTGVGNDLDNAIRGNARGNILEGRDGADIIIGGGGLDTLRGEGGDDTLTADGGILDGGAGADTMTGGALSDTYYVDDPGDAVVETATTISLDTVWSSIDYVLPAQVEWLYLTGTAVTGVGNDLRNVLYGNGEDNWLYGFGDNDSIDGRAGRDHMYGGAGDDTFYVDDPGDIVVERRGEGTADRVYATASFTLPNYVENMDIIGNGVRGTGNDLDNLIRGENFAEIFEGGLGRDTLTGYGGRDTFVFATPLDGDDTITDFVSGTDQIELHGSAFGLAGTGSLAASGVDFKQGTAASLAAPTVVFDPMTHNLYWDADGVGAAAQQLLATLNGVSTLSAGDFHIA